EQLTPKHAHLANRSHPVGGETAGCDVVDSDRTSHQIVSDASHPTGPHIESATAYPNGTCHRIEVQHSGAEPSGLLQRIVVEGRIIVVEEKDPVVVCTLLEDAVHSEGEGARGADIALGVHV